MIYCLNPSCPHPKNPSENRHCQYCGERIALRDRFLALRPIGRGGFGTTYLAQDQDNRNKLCVVKRFTYVSTDPSSTQKAEQLFEQEAERLDQLLHPQIPRLLAYFQEDDYLYLVQEFIAGKTLQAELNEEGKFSEAKIKEVLQGLLPILKFIHSRKVIHRDLKPDNIMRRQTGELVLIDFGVAKLLEQSNVLPGTATTIGTPGYAAPEQIQGRVTPASDLFALGATCFQLLTKAFTSGQVSPVEYDWVQRWHQHTDPAISPELKHILNRLMTVDDRQRYPTAAAVLKDLDSEDIGEAPVVPSPQPANSHSEIATIAVAPAPPQQSPDITVPSLPKVASPPQQPPAGEEPLKKVPVSGGFWLKYGLFTDIGNVIGFAISLVSGVVVIYIAHGSEADERVAEILEVFGIFYGLVGGVIIGAVQRLALKQWVTKTGWWIPTTAVGFLLGTLVTMRINETWLMGFVVGSLVGALQWFMVLRHHTPRARWWILWMAIISSITFSALQGGNPYRIVGWSLFAPLIEGLFLTWLLRIQYGPVAKKSV